MNTTIDATEILKQTIPSASFLRAPYLQQHARTWMALLLALADGASLLAAGLAAVGLRMLIGELINPPFYWRLVPLIGIFVMVYVIAALYPAVGLSPVEELRRLTVSTSAVFLLITAITFWLRSAEYYSRLVFAFSWTFAMITVPLGRWILRIVAVRFNAWGEPVAVVGYGPQGERIVKFLLGRMRFGLRPVVIIQSLETTSDAEAPVPKLLLTDGEDLKYPLRLSGVQTAILIASELPEALQNAIVNRRLFGFQRFILISDLSWIGSLGVTPYDLEGFLGLEIRQNLLNPLEQSVKRLIELFICVTGGMLVFPLCLAIALLIRLDSRGNVLYGHHRLGKGGKSFAIWKFRTMMENADQILEDFLTKNPEALAEWRATHKLKNDPRVTRFGRFLRKTSLDELPQLWNVLKGEMSLVGPRPIVDAEVDRYRQGYPLYQRVLPGITGLWQVSGRTDTSYEERVRFDEYYVRNWSIWLDIYIILRTIWVVIRGEGAY